MSPSGLTATIDMISNKNVVSDKKDPVDGLQEAQRIMITEENFALMKEQSTSS